jgi:hypothetical protein
MPRDMVGNWLYGVAYRTALKARATAAQRMARTRQVTDMPGPQAEPSVLWQDLAPLLDEELSRLPDTYRVPVVLCDLEGKTRKEAARQLGWPEGTVAGRLARARRMLAEALARRGVVLSAGALAAELSRHTASAAAPAVLVGATVKAAGLVTAGQAAAGANSARVAALTERVVRSMVLTKHKTTLVVCLVALLGLGGGALGWPGRAAEDGLPPAQAAGQTPGQQRDDNLKNTLLALDRHLREAAGKGEWREIERFYAPGYLGVGTVGKSRHADNVEAVKHYRPADWKIRDIDVVRVSQDAAVLTYVYDCKVLSPDGRLVQTRRNHRVTLVWGQRNGGWVLVYAHDEHGRQPAGFDAGEMLRSYYQSRVKPNRIPGK